MVQSSNYFIMDEKKLLKDLQKEGLFLEPKDLSKCDESKLLIKNKETAIRLSNLNIQTIDLSENLTISQKSWIQFFKSLFEKDRQGANIQDFKYRNENEKIQTIESMQVID